MGLDAVELVLNVEDTFQIHISDEEAAKTTTVGALYDLILSKIQVPELNAKHCLTSAAFYRTRRALTEVLDIERRKITPSTSLSTLLPLKDRRENWQRIRDTIKLKTPNLHHYIWMFLSLAVLLTVVPVLGGWVSLRWSWLLFIVAIPVSGIFLWRCVPALALAFPDTTVGELSITIAMSNANRLAEELGGLNKREVWEMLRQIIIRQLGVKPEEVTLQARFVEDLHIS